MIPQVWHEKSLCAVQYRPGSIQIQVDPHVYDLDQIDQIDQAFQDDTLADIGFRSGPSYDSYAIPDPARHSSLHAA